MIDRFIMAFVAWIKITATFELNGYDINRLRIVDTARLCINHSSLYDRQALGSLPLNTGLKRRPITKPMNAGNAHAKPISLKGRGTALK